MTRTLRVLHLAKHAPPVRGGIETVVAELLDELARESRLLDHGWTGRYLRDLAPRFSHRQPRPVGVRGAVSYALHRVAVHELDALLYRRNPSRFAQDFPLRWGITDPTDDFRRATGLWREGGRMELSSPQGVVLVSGDTPAGLVVAVAGGLAYVVAVRLARLSGALRYRTVLL